MFLNLLKKLLLLAPLSASLLEADGVLSPAEPSGLSELCADSFPALGVSVLLLLNKLLLRELLQRLKRLLEIEGLESFVDVPVELLLLERAVPLGFVAVGVRVPVEGLRAPILPPRREVQRELMRLLGLVAGAFDVLDVDGFFVPIRLPMRELLLELTRLRELGVGCRLVPELEFVGVRRLNALL